MATIRHKMGHLASLRATEYPNVGFGRTTLQPVSSLPRTFKSHAWQDPKRLIYIRWAYSSTWTEERSQETSEVRLGGSSSEIVRLSSRESCTNSIKYGEKINDHV